MNLKITSHIQVHIAKQKKQLLTQTSKNSTFSPNPTNFQILYCLILYAMLNTQHRNRASYRLMIMLGFIHIGGLQFSGLATAWLAIEGSVFCHHPKVIYWCGALGLGKLKRING
jgi:hypothetical protein